MEFANGIRLERKLKIRWWWFLSFYSFIHSASSLATTNNIDVIIRLSQWNQIEYDWELGPRFFFKRQRDYDVDDDDDNDEESFIIGNSRLRKLIVGLQQPQHQQQQQQQQRKNDKGRCVELCDAPNLMNKQKKKRLFSNDWIWLDLIRDNL